MQGRGNHPLPPKIDFVNGFFKFCFYGGLDTYLKGQNKNDEEFDKIPSTFTLEVNQAIIIMVVIEMKKTPKMKMTLKSLEFQKMNFLSRLDF